MSAPPWLSVVVPTYNGADLLPAALDSVAAQLEPGVEVIAVDDGSTDGTPDVLARYADRLPLTVVRRKVGNWVANTNHGLSLARGEFACILHQDDLWLPGRLAAVRRQLAATPSLTLLLHATRYIGPCGDDLGPWRCPLPARRPLSSTLVLHRLLVQNFVAVPSALFRRDTALAVGGLDESLWYTADWDFWLKLASAGPTAYLPEKLAAFRVHPASQTAGRSRSANEFRAQLEAVPRRYPTTAARPATAAAIEINLALAAGYHRQSLEWRRLLAALMPLTPGDWCRLLRDSRLSERVLARVRAGFLRLRRSG